MSGGRLEAEAGVKAAPLGLALNLGTANKPDNGPDPGPAVKRKHANAFDVFADTASRSALAPALTAPTLSSSSAPHPISL